MKIIIDLDSEQEVMSFPASTIYRKLCDEYYKQIALQNKTNYWSAQTSCDSCARELYAHIKGRKSNVKNLILTYSDAEECFKLFKGFFDVWYNEYDRRINRVTTT